MIDNVPMSEEIVFDEFKTYWNRIDQNQARHAVRMCGGEVEGDFGPEAVTQQDNPGQGFVVLDKGKNKHMMAGSRFEVYDFGKGAVKRSKGFVEVIEVLDYTSRARVIELFSPMNPIVEGDQFENAAYNPDEVIHFYLLGRFSKYGKSDAARRLESLGVKVDKEVEVLRPGDAIYYDSSHPHLVKCDGKGPAKILAVIHAGGK